MKESTGELSMVIVTLLAIILIAGVVRIIVPKAQEYIEREWGELANEAAPNQNPNPPAGT